MTPIEVITSIRQAGGSITVNDDKLRVKAPLAVVNALRSSITECKPVLLSLLAVVEPDLDKPDWWNPELSDSDNQDLDQFFGWSSDPERLAIQWVESLSRIEGQQVVEAAIVQLNEITGCGQGSCEQMDFDEQSQPLAAVLPEGSCEQSELDEQSIEPTACPKCSSISAWFDMTGGRHCDQCEPPTRSQFIAEHVCTLKDQYSAGVFPTKSRAVNKPKKELKPYDEPSKEFVLNKIFAAWGIKPRACPDHWRRSSWIETKTDAGADRFTCAKCGGFVGYSSRKVVHAN
jgi:hypothetical protein